MNARRLMRANDVEEAKYRPYINTGGPLDIINGKFVPTVDGSWVLSGGLGLTTSVIATANKFKSSLQNSSMMNAMARFPDSEAYIYDTEYAAIDKRRLASFSDLYIGDDEKDKREAHITDMIDRIEIHDPTTAPGESLDAWFDYIKEIRDDKIKQAKNLEVETEILDPDTMKPYVMMIPTFIGIDSWTQAPVKQLNVRNEEFTAETETSKQRTIFMEEGLKKAQLMQQLPSISAKGGLVTCLTGHLGKKFSIDGKPVAKDMQHMGQDETVKAMGPKFYFLMSSIFKIANTFPLMDKNDRRLSEYPSENHIAGHELQELLVTATRLKNASSGNQTRVVSAQRDGVMAGLSFYNYLRDSKYFGLGSPNKVRCPLLGDTNLGRTKIFDLSREYRIKRALEIIYQLCIIQSSWTLMGQPVDYTITPEELALKLTTSNSYAIDDILNSRGWWTYKGANVDREYLSLPDILAIVENKYRPKWFAVTQ